MDPTYSPPIKKLRSFRINDLPVIECRREFNLPQQYPSMIAPLKSVATTLKSVTNSSALPQSKKTIEKPDVPHVGEVKKLKLRSQDGKDLGEIDVKFLSEGNILNSQTITFTKSSLYHKISKPVTLAIVPQKNNEVPCAVVQKNADTLKKAVSHSAVNPNMSQPQIMAMTNRRSHKGECVQNSTTNDNVLTKKMVFINDNGQKDIRNVQFVHNTPRYLNVRQNTIMSTNKQQIMTNGQKNGEVIMSNKCNCHDSEKSQPKENVPEVMSKTKSSNTQLHLKSMQHMSLAKSKFPLVKCEKLELSKNSIQPLVKDHNNSNNNNEQDSNADNCVIKTEDCIEEFTDSNINSINNSSPQKQNLTSGGYYTRLSENREKNENIPQICNAALSPTSQFRRQIAEIIGVPLTIEKPTVVSQDVNNTQEQDSTPTLVRHKSVDIEEQCICKPINSSPAPKEKSTENGDTVTNMQKSNVNTSDTNNVSDQSSLSEHWSIIQKAVSSVKDDELRAKALQALANCGIGIERQVPITPPEKLKAVHDTLVQTEVFGLLDNDNFVLVKGDVPNVERMKLTEQTVPDAVNSTGSQTDTITKENSLQNNFIDNSNFLLGPSFVSPVNNLLDLDIFFNDFCQENAEANKIKQVLSAENIRCKKLSAKLQSDFESLKQYDENGMLSIHRAVINNNHYDVQRYLLVMKACKVDVDIQTETGTTSLELAIKYNSSRQVLTLLLEAGAQPVTPELVRESALILACKLSSPHIPQIIRHVKDLKLLDQVDSLGFAPLHYCVLQGNLEGVSVLAEAGAKVNLRDSRSGRTPFFHALESSRVKIAMKLLEHGAIANIPNFSGHTVLSLIDEVKNLSLRNALRKAISN